MKKSLIKVLLVENDTLLSATLAKVLEVNHYTIDLAIDGEAGLDLAKVVEYDLILVAMQVPKLDGISVCRQLRSQGYRKPILLLTENHSDADVIAGFDAGADDYISKPCATEVLLARMRTLLRRSLALSPGGYTQDLSATTLLTWGNLCLDMDSGRVMFGEQVISLTPTEHNLLELFLRNPARIFPIIVFTGRDSLADRLAVSRLGAKQFLHKPATTEQIFRAISQVLTKTQALQAKVLIVDDDQAVLAHLSALLIPWGLEVIKLTEPQRFWEMLVTTSPNLVILDLEMPQVSGLDLCQVVRQDTYWGDLPLLVVTAHTDADSLSQAFLAGADDFITKPVLGPELVTRVLSRIKRTYPRLKPGNT